jgi:hypothetical protein
MKLIPAVIAAAAVIALVGCGNKPRKEEVAECTFPLTKEKAAQWVCPPHEVAGYKDTGFGSYAKTAAGYQFQLDQAAAAARKDLAAQIQARVLAGVKSAIQTTGAPGTPSETVDQVASSVVNQLTEAKLTGSKVVRSATDSKGTVWVLVGMDIEASRRVVQEAVRTSMNNQSAQWQRVVGTRLQSELQAEVLKMTDSR